ncbi:MAG: glycoside hydrolase family 13 protein [Clostridia bacterium]|nr:glycoside hydrolase family 13 protein [Clostridia bacterium]
MNRHAVYHISRGAYAYAIGEYTLCVRLRTAKNDCTTVKVHYLNVYNHSNNRKKASMEKILQDEYYDIYEAQLKLEERHFKYFFELKNDKESVYYTSDGFISNGVKNENSFFFPVINDDEIYTFPKWAEGVTIYQIFVDRFNKTYEKPFINAKWNDIPKRHLFYGGDFNGIKEKLDYIHSLGVDVIYLSPIFSSVTNHKYDIEDFYSIDEMFGGEDQLQDLIKEIHNKKMRIVLDCVFNHMSCYNKIFQDVIEKGKKSLYKDWFYIKEYPISIDRCNYDTFAGCVPSMPRLKTSNPQVIDYLVGASVYWTKKLGIDGWRLDVADEVSVSLWRKFREEILKVNCEALIIGEIWNDASKWMNGDQLHTVTNYKYRKWMMEFIENKIDSSVFWQKISANNALYKTLSYNYLVNLLGSHDTKRLASVVGKNKAILALLTTLVFQGIGLIYYGDEIGLTGKDDPDNRRTMPWDKISAENIKPFELLAKLKNKYPCIKYGKLIPIVVNENILAFERSYKNKNVEVYVNFTNKDILIESRKSIFYYSFGEMIDEKTMSINRIRALSFAICIKK